MVGQLTKSFSLGLLLIISLSLSAQDELFIKANNQEAYLSVNQPYYISGQKVWFSFWLFDADSQRLVKGDQLMDLHLVDHEGNRVIEKRIKVKSGRSYGQFSLPEELETHEYLIHLGFQGEKVSEYIYASKLTVYNKEESLSSDITISTSQENSFEKLENGGDLVFLN